MLKKSLSAPTHDTCSSSLVGFDLQQPSSIVKYKARKDNPEANVDVTKPEMTSWNKYTKMEIPWFHDHTV